MVYIFLEEKKKEKEKKKIEEVHRKSSRTRKKIKLFSCSAYFFVESLLLHVGLLRLALSSLRTCSNPSSVDLAISIILGETKLLFCACACACACASAVCRFFIKQGRKSVNIVIVIKIEIFCNLLLFVAFLVDVVFLVLFLLLHKFQFVLSIIEFTMIKLSYTNQDQSGLLLTSNELEKVEIIPKNSSDLIVFGSSP